MNEQNKREIQEENQQIKCLKRNLEMKECLLSSLQDQFQQQLRAKDKELIEM